VVWAAGNSGPSPWSSVSPANYPESFVVGESDPFYGGPSVSTARGPSACDGRIYPDLPAPGGVRTTDLTFGALVPQSYTYVHGTSFAAAQAAGIMALLKSIFPQAGVADLETALRSTGDPASSGAEQGSGYGLINARRAYAWLVHMLPRDLNLESEGSGRRRKR
jgi:subtilisin family serine protease